MTVCCCSNELDAAPSGLRVRMSPCRCKKPGPGKRTLRQPGLPQYVFENQYNERTRLGLPLETDIEKGVRSKWR